MMSSNKKIIVWLIAFLSVILVACQNDNEKYLNDKIPPVLRVESGYSNAIIYQGEEINLFEGLVAIDNLEGDITDKIEVDSGDFDKDIVGTYEVIFYVKDRAQNVSNFIYKTIEVRRMYTILERYPIYSGVIENEIFPTVENCFPGAFYHKVNSSKDYWIGIEAEVTLPFYKIDRYQSDFDATLPADPNKKNLDNPSLYFGGNARLESDVGLSMSLVLLKDGSISVGSYAFRPFWRYITNKDYDLGTYDRLNGRFYAVSCTGSGTQRNCFGQWDYQDTQYYYLPGDRLRIVVASPEPGKMQLQIEVIEKSTLAYSLELRSENGWKDPENFISPIFSSPGQGTNIKTSFKRVNAIDQVANEGKPATSTTTEVFDTIWHNTYLYRVIDNQIHRIPMTKERAAIMDCPNPNFISRTELDKNGGEVISIHPNRED
ncbi:MAG: hypothetical protein M0P92_04205 [Acholeplasmataceae bacterium]|jgi:hypothetical protein|nr:hypothetical protein [Acholeplasmataceae bacterium]MCK9233770.1 hypothetical protein [Acholeplasmataceae bacterium]MCK9427870.1 hypothetical protein [Acholeplasmataceae bacterium]